MAALGGGFPVDLVVAVARNILTELLELATFADLALRVNTEPAPVQEQGRELPALAEQVRVHAHFRVGGHGPANGPEPQRRRTLEIDVLQRKHAASQRRARPGHLRSRRVSLKRDKLLFVFVKNKDVDPLGID